MVGMMHFLAEGAAFVPGTVLQPGSLPPPLAPPAPAETSEMRVFGIMRAAVAEVITRGTVPLLSFTNVVGKMSAPNGHFKPPLACDPETFASRTFLLSHLRALGQNLHSSICFTFLQNLRENGHRTRSIGHPRNLEHMVQVTVIWKAGNVGLVLRARVTTHGISSFLLDPR
jgi:hypothetical protein